MGRDILGFHSGSLSFDNDEDNCLLDWDNDHKMTGGSVSRNNYQKNDFLPLHLNRIKIDVCTKIAHKLDLMRTKESWLKTEIQETLRTLKRLEDKMRIVAKTYEVDKLKLHIQE